MERLGIVFIASAFPQRQGEPTFTGYWDRGDPPEMLERGPGWDDVEEAIAWGRDRAPRVMVRLGRDDSSIYSAGDIRVTRYADGGGPAYPRWPPAGERS